MKQRPRVVMIAPAFAPNFFSEALVNSKLALAMLDAGWEVLVVSATASKDSVYAESWDDPWKPLQEIVHQVDPQVGPLDFFKISNAVRALISGRHPVSGAIWAARVAEKIIKKHEQNPFDLLVTRSTSCIAHLPGLIVKRKTKIKWIANWNDPPKHLFPSPYEFETSHFERVFMERYLRDVANKADINTFPSRRLMNYLSGPLRLTDRARMAVVPHIGLGWQGRPPREEKTTFRICHAGNLSTERNPIEFLLALSKAIIDYPKIKFEFNLIGKIDVNIIAEVQRLGLADVVIHTPNLSFNDCLKCLESADALLLIEASVQEGIFFPSKVVDYCEAGRPILAISPRVGVINDLIEKYQFAYFAETGNADSVWLGLDKLIRDWIEGNVPYSGLSQLRRMTSPDSIISQIARLAWKNTEEA